MGARDREPHTGARGPSDDALRDVPVQRGPGRTPTGGPTEPHGDLVDGAQRPDTQGVPQDEIARGSTRSLDHLGGESDTPRPSERPIGEIRTTPGERPPTEDLPRTMEKPGSGTPREPGNDFPYTREKQPVPGQEQRDPPRPERQRPTGQITDESGEYGPLQTWYKSEPTPWLEQSDPQKPKREPPTGQITDERGKYGPVRTGKGAVPKRALKSKVTGMAPAAYIVGAAVALGLGLGVLNRPAVPPAATAGSAAQSAAAAATAPAPGDIWMGPLKVTRDPNSTTSRFSIEMFEVPPGDFKWTLDAPCGVIGSTQLGALVGWSYDANTKTCPPGPQGPFPGKVIFTFTSAKDGKVYTWTAGSETGSYGEKVTIR